jgi:hypothetical protein
MTPLNTYSLSPAVVACWLAASPWKTSSGAKNSRVGTLKEKFRKSFQKPWSTIYSTEMFTKMVFLDNWSWAWRKEEWWFSKERTLVIMYSPGAINPCNRITLVWDGA